MYIYFHVFINIYVYKHVFIFIYTHFNVYTYRCIGVCTCVYVYTEYHIHVKCISKKINMHACSVKYHLYW